MFSSMIRVIIPIAVHHELQDNTAQKSRFEKQFEGDFGVPYVLPADMKTSREETEKNDAAAAVVGDAA
jgi:hypothetical protein